MTVTVKSLEPQIRGILSAPGTDLSTISAKRVRKQLLEMGVSADFVKENKGEIDALIARVYEDVSDAANGVKAESAGDYDEDEEAGTRANRRAKRKRDEDADSAGDEEEVEEEEEATPPPKAKAKAKRAKKTEMTDEELARQLSDEINGRASRSSRAKGSTRGGRGGGKGGGKRGKKSAATVDTDGEGSEGEGKKKRRGGGFQKEYALSEPLTALLTVDKLSRPQVVKGLWDYIKGHGLQNPECKREIICDDSLKAVFNVDKIDMFKMNKVLGQHLSEIAPPS